MISNNTVIDDYTYGAGVAVDSSDPVIEGCVIVSNSCTGFSSDAGGVYTLFNPAPTLLNCTIAYNASSSSEGTGGLLAHFNSFPVVERSIIAFQSVGAAFGCDSGAATVDCSNIYGNAGGDAVCGGSVARANISVDPMFCGAPNDLRLQAGSPCLSVCGGPIGARPTTCGVTGVDVPEASFALLGNHPNPFNPSTTIVFRLDAPGHVDVRITDLTGRVVATLTQGDLPAGRHEAVWYGRDDEGRPVSSGVYLYELESRGTRQTRRMILIK